MGILGGPIAQLLIEQCAVFLALLMGASAIHKVARRERTLGVSKLPYAALIDETGKLAATGLVNTREHLESLFVAKERGVASIQQYLRRDTQRVSAGE